MVRDSLEESYFGNFDVVSPGTVSFCPSIVELILLDVLVVVTE